MWTRFSEWWSNFGDTVSGIVKMLIPVAISVYTNRDRRHRKKKNDDD